MNFHTHRDPNAHASDFLNWAWTYPCSFTQNSVFISGEYTSNVNSYFLRPNLNYVTHTVWRIDTFNPADNPQTFAVFLAIGY